MRQGELLGLRWADVDLDAARLHVSVAWQRRGEEQGGYALAEPKTASSRRQITLAPVAVDALRHHRARQLEERLGAGPAWQDNDLVFCNTLGRPIGASNLRRRSFEPLLKKAGLPHIRFHDLRHTAATLLLKQKVPVKVVSEMLGHSQVGVTLNVYAHVMPDMQREAAAAMQNLLG
jgi:integrase